MQPTRTKTPEQTAASQAVSLVTAKDEARVDSRVIAEHLGNKHQNVFELLKDYQADFEEFGILRFQTGEIKGRGQPEKFALLTEDQCYLLLTYSRNTAKVRALKVKLVKAFREARESGEHRQTEYLPTYHALHDQIAALAAKSSNPRLVHLNLNKLVNKITSIEAGGRGSVPLPKRSLLVTAQILAANAMKDAADHRDAYAKAKAALQPLHMHLIGNE